MEIKNKKAYFNYYVLKEIEAGIELVGTEIKSILKIVIFVLKIMKFFLLILILKNMNKEIILIMKQPEKGNYYFIKKK